MAKLVFSKGLSIEQSLRGFLISHDDDIIIESNIQIPIYNLKSSQSIHIHQSIGASEIFAPIFLIFANTRRFLPSIPTTLENHLIKIFDAPDNYDLRPIFILIF